MPLGAFKLNAIAKGASGIVFNTITATGGTVTDYQESGVWYRSHSFENSRVNKAVTAIGNTKTSTAQKKFGSSSALFDGSGDSLLCYKHSDYAFGTNDHTFEFWIRFNSLPASGAFMMASSSTSFKYLGFKNTSGTYSLELGASPTGSSTAYYAVYNMSLSTNTWYHFAIVKNNGSFSVYKDGSAVSLTSSAGTMDSSKVFFDGATYLGQFTTGTHYLNGYMDEIRLSKVARYTSNFTAPSAAFTNDANTVLLLHCEGTNAAQRFADDSQLSYTLSVSGLGSSNGVVQYLNVAGGGAGGSHDGLYRTPGGGGAGGVKVGTASVTATNYTITVGAGGMGATGRDHYSRTTDASPSPMNGTGSSALSVATTGGGAGGMYQVSNSGLAGGSGGGGGSGEGTSSKTGGAGTSGEGSAGGNSYANGANGDLAGGGGGGGKSGAGSNSDYANNKGGAGGAGVNNTYKDGTTIGYGGGGGGSGFSTTANNTSQGGAATHGGGAGNAYGRGTSGTHGTGGGGGGGNGLGYTEQNGGDGGSGIVVIRYPWNSANNF